jgi:hypothetical protein
MYKKSISINIEKPVRQGRLSLTWYDTVICQGKIQVMTRGTYKTTRYHKYKLDMDHENYADVHLALTECITVVLHQAAFSISKEMKK